MGVAADHCCYCSPSYKEETEEEENEDGMSIEELLSAYELLAEGYLPDDIASVAMPEEEALERKRNVGKKKNKLFGR